LSQAHCSGSNWRHLFLPSQLASCGQPYISCAHFVPPTPMQQTTEQSLAPLRSTMRELGGKMEKDCGHQPYDLVESMRATWALQMGAPSHIQSQKGVRFGFVTVHMVANYKTETSALSYRHDLVECDGCLHWFFKRNPTRTCIHRVSKLTWLCQHCFQQRNSAVNAGELRMTASLLDAIPAVAAAKISCRDSERVHAMKPTNSDITAASQQLPNKAPVTCFAAEEDHMLELLVLRAALRHVSSAPLLHPQQKLNDELRCGARAVAKQLFSGMLAHEREANACMQMSLSSVKIQDPFCRAQHVQNQVDGAEFEMVLNAFKENLDLLKNNFEQRLQEQKRMLPDLHAISKLHKVQHDKWVTTSQICTEEVIIDAREVEQSAEGTRPCYKEEQ